MAYNVFLSFALEDKIFVDLFREEARKQGLHLEFQHHSTKDLDTYRAWQSECKGKIRRCSVTICLVGHKTHQSGAVDWEIRRSIELGKGVIAVYLRSGHPPLPRVIRENRITPLRWDMDEVMNEIRRLAK